MPYADPDPETVRYCRVAVDFPNLRGSSRIWYMRCRTVALARQIIAEYDDDLPNYGGDEGVIEDEMTEDLDEDDAPDAEGTAYMVRAVEEGVEVEAKPQFISAYAYLTDGSRVAVRPEEPGGGKKRWEG